MRLSRVLQRCQLHPTSEFNFVLDFHSKTKSKRIAITLRAQFFLLRSLQVINPIKILLHFKQQCGGPEERKSFFQQCYVCVRVSDCKIVWRGIFLLSTFSLFNIRTATSRQVHEGSNPRNYENEIFKQWNRRDFPPLCGEITDEKLNSSLLISVRVFASCAEGAKVSARRATRNAPLALLDIYWTRRFCARL